MHYRCPHANACLTCSHFRTTAEFLNDHKRQLEQTQKILDKAKANGWVRQIEMNENVKMSLENIVKTLEDPSDG
jgi:integrase/recombinase XerD